MVYVDYYGYTWFTNFGYWVGQNWRPIVTIAATVGVTVGVTVLTAGTATPLLAAAYVGAAGGFTSGALGTWLNEGSFGQGLLSGFVNGAVGAVAGMAGGAVAGWASKNISGFALNSLQLSGKSAIGGALSGAIGGAAAGAAGGFVTGLAMTGDFNKALQMAGQGAIFGGIAGAAFGGYKGFRAARATGSNPWTGQARSNDLSKTFNLDGTLKRISNGESFPHKNDGSVFENRKGFLPEKPDEYYHEYVHPTEGIQHAGLQRIVIGNKGEIYYTPDHYKTFTKIY